MPNEQLNDAEIDAQASQLTLWTLQKDRLCRQFVFNDFVAAFNFMTQVADLAEQSNHHPEWSNVYNKVEIALTTHEFNNVSQRDFDLAKKIDLLKI